MKKPKDQILMEQEKKHRKRHAGRFLILLFLLALAGFLFYRGWIQREIPIHTRAVLFSKTSGFEPAVFRPGSFLWRWERILPGNMTILVFPDTNAEVLVSGSNYLPSGETYGNWLGDPTLFKFSYQLNLKYKINDEDLLWAVKSEGLTPESYQTLISKGYETIPQFIQDALYQSYEKESEAGDPEEAIRSLENEKLGHFTIISLSVEKLTQPDPLLYQKAREGFWTEVEKRQSLAALDLPRRVTMEKDHETRLEILQKYGELLTQYPILIDFLKVSRNDDLTQNP